jgi:hypothetical protein
MPGGWTCVFVGLAMVALPDAARGATQNQPERHVRWNDESAARLLNDALERSETVRVLFEKIQASDLLLYVIVEASPGTPRGRTSIVSKGGAIRMLHTVINGTLDSDERIIVLAHEFQHVIEMAEAAEVVDQDGMRRLFRRIGYQVGLRAENYETAAAEAVERRVRAEIRKRRERPHDTLVGPDWRDILRPIRFKPWTSCTSRATASPVRARSSRLIVASAARPEGRLSSTTG